MEKVPEQRPVMCADLFTAAIEGNKAVLVQRLGLLDDEEQSHVKVQIEASDSAPQQTATKSHSFKLELQSATRFGNTILHLLVANNRHNELAVKVFHKDTMLLTAQNKELETPLHCAAMVGNVKVIQSFIQFAPDAVRNAVRITNGEENTALHVATKNVQKEVVRELMRIDPEMAYKFNKEGLSPLHMAIADDNIDLLKIMIEVDPSTVPCTQFSDGTFPIHVAARMSKEKEIIRYFLDEHRQCALLLDSRGRNLFHIAAVENKGNFIKLAEKENEKEKEKEKFTEMISAKDYEGNTPLHIATMKGYGDMMLELWEIYSSLGIDKEIRNNKGLTPFDISETDQLTKIGRGDVESYIKRNGRVFTLDWCNGLDSKWTSQQLSERIPVIGLGSVLIATVTFAAAFTIPGGYNANNGAPVLGGRYMFRAFVIANSMAFAEAFGSVVILIFIIPDRVSRGDKLLLTALVLFIAAAGSMVQAFGIGSYLMLAPFNMPLAIIILVSAMLLGSPLVVAILGLLHWFLDWFFRSDSIDKSNIALSLRIIAGYTLFSLPYLLIFGVASLK